METGMNQANLNSSYNHQTVSRKTATLESFKSPEMLQ